MNMFHLLLVFSTLLISFASSASLPLNYDIHERQDNACKPNTVAILLKALNLKGLCAGILPQPKVTSTTTFTSVIPYTATRTWTVTRPIIAASAGTGRDVSTLLSV
ncbi:hypothetical protein K469DRAFT_222279 [Zopfia rhizophila CBS 207.26]|uniref:Uncharacterized protein n=1 Tax=Zopfia rhizophila CBS 207.26 TaxID=1314779 RepID=A0A6A6DY38_9PEZI|nr:hypothetical protein K469DRAFT_222279 [Zopfia rhizophila CBS 207.26]